MNDERGNFVPLTKTLEEAFKDDDGSFRGENAKDVFKVGEEVVIKHSRFKVDRIARHTLRLKLLPGRAD